MKIKEKNQRKPAADDWKDRNKFGFFLIMHTYTYTFPSSKAWFWHVKQDVWLAYLPIIFQPLFSVSIFLNRRALFISTISSLCCRGHSATLLLFCLVIISHQPTYMFTYIMFVYSMICTHYRVLDILLLQFIKYTS